MGVSRRGFLGALGAAIAGATLDPERALWVPGARAISVPAPRMLGISIRLVRAFDVVNNVFVCRMDTGLVPTPSGFRNFGAQWQYDFHPERAAEAERCARRQLEHYVSKTTGRPVNFLKEVRCEILG